MGFHGRFVLVGNFVWAGGFPPFIGLGLVPFHVGPSGRVAEIVGLGDVRVKRQLNSTDVIDVLTDLLILRGVAPSV